MGVPGYSARGESNKEDINHLCDDTLYQNDLDEDNRTISVRLLPAKEDSYEYEMQYDLIPNDNGLMKSLVVYWIFALFGGLGLLFVALSGNFSEHHVWGQAISAAFITASIGLIFALNADWANRYRILSIILLIIHGIGWIVWGLIGDSTLMV